MLYRALFLLLAVTSALTVFGQSKLTVIVSDQNNGNPVDLAYVNLYTPGQKSLIRSSQTDEQGVSVISVSEYPTVLQVVATGFEPVHRELKDSASLTIRIALERKAGTLQEVVVTGLTGPARLKDALSNYQVINKATMQAQGAVTVSDALKNQLNINIGNDNLLGAQTSMQGMKGDKVKILVDGLPLNGRENGQIDLGQINLNNVERIEIIQGPMSVVYGTDALGGVINIITKKTAVRWQLQAGSYYETVGKYNADAAVSYGWKGKHQLSLSGGRNFFQGWQALDTLERSFLWKPKEQYFGNLSYSLTGRNAFKLQAALDLMNEKITNKDSGYKITPFYARARDEYYYNTRVLGRLSFSGKLGRSGTWQVQNGYAYYQRVRNRYIKDMVNLEQELDRSAGVQDTTRFTDYTFRGSYTGRRGKLGYTLGYDINLQKGSSGKIPDERKGQEDYAVYASLPYTLYDGKLVLQPAVRLLYNTVYKAPVIPSINLLYKSSDALQLRFSYAKGFRAPSMKELYLYFYDINHEVEGNPHLKAEKGDHLQASVSYTPVEKEDRYARFVFTGFYNNVSDQIAIYQPDTARPAYATYTNIARSRNMIGTIQAEGSWRKFYVAAGFSGLQLLNKDTGIQKFSVQATLSVQYKWSGPDITLSSFYKLFGRQPRLVSTIDGGAAYNGTIDPYSFWDASIEKKFFKNKLQVIVGAKNLLDIQSATVDGATVSGVHSGGAGGAQNIATGRSFFSALRITLP